jgi:hypothetical protein
MINMACDNLTHTISFSKTNPVVGETVTCTATVTNNGATTEQFHVSFAQQGLSPFFTSTVKTIAPGATISIPTTFQGMVTGTINICANVLCDTQPSGVFQFYPSDYFWNVRADHLPVHANNATYINYLNSPAGTRQKAIMGVWENAQFNYVNDATPRKTLTYWDYMDTWKIWQNGDYTIQYPVPPDAKVSGVNLMGENTYYMIDTSANICWAMYDGRLNYRVAYPDPTLISSPGDMACIWSAKFDMTNYALRPNGQSGCSMSGLLPVPGLIRKAEIDAGVINHALFCSLYHISKDWVYPARASGSNSTYPIPNGTRFRMRADYDISGYSGAARTVLNCMKKYGFFALENTGNHEFTFGSEIGVGLSWSNFTSIPPTSLEAVDMSSMIINTNTGQMKAGTF